MDDISAIQRQKTHNIVAATGSLIGFSSVFLTWFTVRPNRLAQGVNLNAMDSVGVAAAAVIATVWLTCFIISLHKTDKRQIIILGILANVVIIILSIVTGLAAFQLLYEGSSTRISLGPGIWITLVAIYMVVFSVRQNLLTSSGIKNALTWFGTGIFLILLFTGWFNGLSIMQEFSGREDRFFQELLHHIALVAVAVICGTLIGLTLGIWAIRSKTAGKPILAIVNIAQTIPSLALFGLLIAPLSTLSFTFPALREIGIQGVGDAPAIIALTVYSLLPIVLNTYTGIKHIDPAVIAAGLGMGMTRRQLFRRIEVPLAAPLVLEGIRTASVQSVGLAAISALIGAGGLGWFIFQGLGQAADDLILLGAIPIILLALLIDAVMQIIIKLVKPRG